ncbi:MAG: PPE domain-containing protein [Pseudonocardiaceae bacterium]|nr:PPE domain-containing protein [Pseudonocardiaceae bacterium]
MDVPEGYEHDRRNRTWREVHGWSERASENRHKTSKARRRNREAGRFGKVNWDAYQHDQLYDMIMKANLGEMSTRAGQWSALAAKIEATTGEVQRVMERVMGAWRGQAAVNSAASNSRLMQWAADASHTANTVAAGMSTYTDAVGRAQTHMPDPAFATAERNFRDGYTVTGTGGPSTAVLLRQLLSDGMVSHEQARARKAEAVQVMETYESQSKDVHDSMPHFSSVAPTTNEQPAGWTSRPGEDYGGGGAAPPPVPPRSGSDPGVATTAASFVNPQLSGTPGTPGLGGGTGFGGGLGSLGSGGSDVIRNSPSFGGLAGGAPFGGRGPAAGAGAFGTRGAGGPGSFGGMPMGHGTRGDEDKEHKNKYDEGMDFLDDLPPAYPPVFGA